MDDGITTLKLAALVVDAPLHVRYQIVTRSDGMQNLTATTDGSSVAGTVYQRGGNGGRSTDSANSEGLMIKVGVAVTRHLAFLTL
ncbi:MAG: hypothetical protein J0G33_04055 [Afipia felis]|nr:hypothetical protein [Afipia felis]